MNLVIFFISAYSLLSSPEVLAKAATDATSTKERNTAAVTVATTVSEAEGKAPETETKAPETEPKAPEAEGKKSEPESKAQETQAALNAKTEVKTDEDRPLDIPDDFDQPKKRTSFDDLPKEDEKEVKKDNDDGWDTEEVTPVQLTAKDVEADDKNDKTAKELEKKLEAALNPTNNPATATDTKEGTATQKQDTTAVADPVVPQTNTTNDTANDSKTKDAPEEQQTTLDDNKAKNASNASQVTSDDKESKDATTVQELTTGTNKQANATTANTTRTAENHPENNYVKEPVVNVILTRADGMAHLSEKWAENPAVETTGFGGSKRQAIDSAIGTAMEQYYGFAATASETIAMNDDSSIATSSFNKSLKGRVAGYDFLEIIQNVTEGLYQVTLKVYFTKPYDLAQATANRQRIVVAPFASNAPTHNFLGYPLAAGRWTERLADNLNTHLTQTRKFSVLDRKFENAVNSELARLNQPNLPQEEYVRMNQQLLTDYLVVGTIIFHDVLPGKENPYTGKRNPTPNQLFAEINYRIILVPTGQIKWADSLKLQTSQFALTNLASFEIETAEFAATTISDSLMANIFPFDVAKVLEDGTLIIGEGGKSLTVGEYLTVFKLGDVVYDDRTGEPIDRIETPVAVIQVTRVLPKISYAQIAQGDVANVTAGCRLRRTIPEGGTPVKLEQPRPNTQIKQTPSGGYILNF